MAREKSQSEGGYNSTSLDVGNDICSCIEQIKDDKSNRLVGLDVPTLTKWSISLQRRQRRQMAAARRKMSVMSLSDNSEQLYTLVNGVIVHVWMAKSALRHSYR